MVAARYAQRFRQKAISVKTPIIVYHADQLPADLDEGTTRQRDVPAIETGVDKEEESEHHLQAAISAAQAAAVSGEKARDYHIPTPSASGVVADYDHLYPKHRFIEPSSHIRFSATVEETTGIEYTLDDDDDDWLQAYNNGKAKSEVVSESDLEKVMDLFEKTTDETIPFLYTDVSRIPSADILVESMFQDVVPLRALAKAIYPHWKSRRVARNGKSIMPKTHFDDADEADPYTCFRRREVKQVRKTRRTDLQSLERLRRLRAELQAAKDIMSQVLVREKMKKDQLVLEQQVFEQKHRFKDLKRRLGIKEDEDLLLGKTVKKVKAPVNGETAGTIRIPLRKVRLDGELSSPPPSIEPPKNHALILAAAIEAELNRKRERDHMWEDVTETSYHPSAQPTQLKFFRYVAPDSVHHSEHRKTSHRKRIGRGGRMFLDRRIPLRKSDLEHKGARFLCDDDDHPSEDDDDMVIDDFNSKYVSYRAGLLSAADLEMLSPSVSHLMKAKACACLTPPKAQISGVITAPPRPIGMTKAATPSLLRNHKAVATAGNHASSSAAQANGIPANVNIKKAPTKKAQNDKNPSDATTDSQSNAPNQNGARKSGGPLQAGSSTSTPVSTNQSQSAQMNNISMASNTPKARPTPNGSPHPGNNSIPQAGSTDGSMQSAGSPASLQNQQSQLTLQQLMVMKNALNANPQLQKLSSNAWPANVRQQLMAAAALAAQTQQQQQQSQQQQQLIQAQAQAAAAAAAAAVNGEANTNKGANGLNFSNLQQNGQNSQNANALQLLMAVQQNQQQQLILQQQAQAAATQRAANLRMQSRSPSQQGSNGSPSAKNRPLGPGLLSSPNALARQFLAGNTPNNGMNVNPHGSNQGIPNRNMTASASPVLSSAQPLTPGNSGLQQMNNANFGALGQAGSQFTVAQLQAIGLGHLPMNGMAQGNGNMAMPMNNGVQMPMRMQGPVPNGINNINGLAASPTNSNVSPSPQSNRTNGLPMGLGNLNGMNPNILAQFLAMQQAQNQQSLYNEQTVKQ